LIFFFIFHFIFDLIRKIVNAKNGGDKVVLWGTGEQTRELIYIKDAVDIICEGKNEYFIQNNLDGSYYGRLRISDCQIL
jgi:nucleoside-diphosphate-sugar epimerase